MLDIFFRKYAWTANLVLLFAAAWLSAKTVNTIVAAFIRPTPQIDLTSVPSAPVRSWAPASLETDRLYPLIGQKPPAPAAESEEPAQMTRVCTDREAAPVRSTLRAQLVAGVIAERPQWSIASITDASTRETKVYGIGDQVLGATLLSVERIRDERDGTGVGFRVAAILCNSGQKEYLDFEPGEVPAAAPIPGFLGAGVRPGGAPDGEPTALIPPDGIRKLADNRYEIKKSVIDNTLSNLNTVATQARIVPSFRNGVANGFKVFSIQPGSLYAGIGVENGDVIQKINGYEINSPDKALEVYQKLRESPHITLEVERNGQVIRKEYNIGGP